MALSPKYVCFLSFLTLLFSLHIQARDSQFFSKVTTTTNNNNVQETQEVPNKEQHLTNQDQEPTFIPQTENGYGLYGHKSGQLPPSTTTNHPYKSESQEPFENPNTYKNNYYYNKEETYMTEPQGMGDNKYYTTGKEGMSDTRFLENGKYFYDLNTQANYNNGYQNSRGVYYNNKGYYGKNENSYKNSMNGYQNQENQDEFMP